MIAIAPAARLWSGRRPARLPPAAARRRAAATGARHAPWHHAPSDRPGRTLRPDRARATPVGGRPSSRPPSRAPRPARAGRRRRGARSSTSAPGPASWPSARSQRWPDVSVVGVDASAGMVGRGRRRGRSRCSGPRSATLPVRGRLRRRAAVRRRDVRRGAVVVRAPARAEPRRAPCARPGASCGRAALFAYVSWLADERAFAPGRVVRRRARRIRRSRTREPATVGRATSRRSSGGRRAAAGRVLAT